MNRKRELLIQLVVFPFLVMGSTILYVHVSFSEITFDRVLEAFVLGITFRSFHQEIPLLALLVLLIYNFVAGLIWIVMKYIKHRKEIRLINLLKPQRRKRN